MSDSRGGFFRRLFGRRKDETSKAEPERADEIGAPGTPEGAPSASSTEEPTKGASATEEAGPSGEAAAPVPDQTVETPAGEAPQKGEAPAAVSGERDEDNGGGGWLARLRRGLSKSSTVLGGGITGIFSKRKLDADTLQDLEDILIQADLGVDMAERVIERIRKGRYEKGIGPDEVKAILADEVTKVPEPVEKPFDIPQDTRPFVVLVVGVNGSGKTTTIGKLAAIARREGHSVMLVAGDTFRAAAVEQLGVWAERAGARFMSRDTGADPAALAFDALKTAQQEDVDIVFMDTAGRLQNRKELMEELAKIVRVMKKVIPDAPHATLLVLDATTGQNAMNQVEVFREVAGVTGLVMTKLDGTARGGILVAIAERHGIPVHAIGVGEKIDDLQPFDAKAFARAIAGVEENA